MKPSKIFSSSSPRAASFVEIVILALGLWLGIMSAPRITADARIDNRKGLIVALVCTALRLARSQTVRAVCRCGR